MASPFRQFKQYNNEPDAMQFIALLESHDIEVELEKVNNYMDSVLIGALNKGPDFLIKLRAEDFERAEELLDELVQEWIDEVPRDYHLFEFEDDELKEIVEKSNEWSREDYHLAIHILNERGYEYTPSYQEHLKSQRNSQLRKSKSVAKWNIAIAYAAIALFVFGVLTNTAIPFSWYVIGWPLVLGAFLINSKKTLSNGKRYYFYDKKSRKQGKILFVSSLITIAAVIAGLNIFLFFINN